MVWHYFKEISRFALEKTSREPGGITSYKYLQGRQRKSCESKNIKCKFETMAAPFQEGTEYGVRMVYGGDFVVGNYYTWVL